MAQNFEAGPKNDIGPKNTELSPQASLQLQSIQYERTKYASELVAAGGLSPEAVIRCAKITAEGNCLPTKL